MNPPFFSFAAEGPHFLVFFIPNKQAYLSYLILHGYVTLLLSPSFWLSYSSTEQFPYCGSSNIRNWLVFPHVFFAKHLFLSPWFWISIRQIPGCRTQLKIENNHIPKFQWDTEFSVMGSTWVLKWLRRPPKAVFLTSEYPLSSAFVKLKQIVLQTFWMSSISDLWCGFCWLEVASHSD